MRFLKKIIILPASALLLSGAGPDRCQPMRETIEGSVATASVWANMRGTEDSLSSVAKRMIEKVLAAMNDPGKAVCDAGCGSAKGVTAEVSSIPSSFLEADENQDECRAMLEKTKQQPFIYGPRDASNLDEVGDWFGDVGQGKGADGRDLYAKCPGGCSPQYFLELYKEAGNTLARLKALCGPKRNKSENQYKLTSTLSWSCSKR